jgi:transposase
MYGENSHQAVSPIEKSTSSASVLAQVIVAKYADHLPLHRQAKMFRRFCVGLSNQTLCGWKAQCAQLLQPLYQRLNGYVLASKVVGTDDTPVKVLDRKLPQARKGRIWAVCGRSGACAAAYDYTATRERAGPEEFLKQYRGHLQADAYADYDAFFSNPERGLMEVGRWAHARRHFHQALESDRSLMRTVLLLIAQLQGVERTTRERGRRGEELRVLRQHGSQSVLDQLHAYLLEISFCPKERSRPSGGLYLKELDGPDALLR